MDINAMIGPAMDGLRGFMGQASAAVRNFLENNSDQIAETGKKALDGVVSFSTSEKTLGSVSDSLDSFSGGDGLSSSLSGTSGGRSGGDGLSSSLSSGSSK